MNAPETLVTNTISFNWKQNVKELAQASVVVQVNVYPMRQRKCLPNKKQYIFFSGNKILRI